MRQTEPNAPPPRRKGRAARTHALRLRATALAITLFIAAWVVIGVQMASGHDPRLSKSSTAVAATVSTPTTTSGNSTTSTGTTTTGTTSSNTGTSTSGTSTSGTSTTSVTTSQS
jgi:hypothetical protein